MEELERILKEHAVRYPLMAPADAVKLIYQNEFGGGHLIRDAEGCLAYLRREYAAVQHDDTARLYEPIGNGIIRVYLAALPADQLETLGNVFIASAAAHRGSLQSFRKKLEILRRLTGEGVFSFDSEALDTYLCNYEKAGYPPVSHSETYRRAYSPAYRVVKEGCMP